MRISFADASFLLLPERAIFWEAENTLLIADAHFSKEQHFRKHGIAVPGGILRNDLERIASLVGTYPVREIVFLGDMFHSDMNEGVQEFLEWRKKMRDINCTLVIGNHDVLDPAWYTFAGIRIVEDTLRIQNIVLRHAPGAPEKDRYQLCGHVHPCIRLKGKAKQSVRIPCFHFGKESGILPAFGGFTGMHAMPADADAIVIGIADGNLIRIQ